MVAINLKSIILYKLYKDLLRTKQKPLPINAIFTSAQRNVIIFSNKTISRYEVNIVLEGIELMCQICGYVQKH